MVSDSNDLGSAARALSAAVTALTRVVGQGLADAGREVSDEIVAELRKASDELEDASARVVVVGVPRRKKTRKADADPPKGPTDAAARRRARAEATRTQLLAAAAAVFAQKGYEGSSVGDVAAEAGYTKGAVYTHFSSKEDLLLGIVEMMSAQDEAHFAAGSTSVRDLLCSGDGDPEALSRTLLALEIYTYAIRHPDAQPHLAPLVATTWDRTAEVLAAADGRTEPTQDDRDLALALLSVHTFAQVFGPVLGDDAATESAGRTIDRLLGEG